MTFIKRLVLIVLIPFILFIILMNLTPGHFQTSQCGCDIQYVNTYDNIMCMPIACNLNLPERILHGFLTSISVLDFNK